MAIIILTRPIEFPVATIRGLLIANLPTLKWQVGEDDNGGWDDISTLSRPQLIIGREGADVIFTTIERTEAPLTGVAHTPNHIHHITVAPPTTDDAVLAERIVASVCAGLMMRQDNAAYCQMTAAGPWLSTEHMERAMIAIEAGNALETVVSEGGMSHGDVPSAAGGAQPGDQARFSVACSTHVSTEQSAPPTIEAPMQDLQHKITPPNPQRASLPVAQAVTPLSFGRKGL
jgi:hypothetical protein